MIVWDIGWEADLTAVDWEKWLTPRESKVLHLMGQGMTNKGISGALGISAHTVKFLALSDLVGVDQLTIVIPTKVGIQLCLSGGSPPTRG